VIREEPSKEVTSEEEKEPAMLRMEGAKKHPKQREDTKWEGG
jgi:hypothetical protein